MLQDLSLLPAELASALMSPDREISTCAFWESWCWRLRWPAAWAIALSRGSQLAPRLR
jgi:hypothetical protein